VSERADFGDKHKASSNVGVCSSARERASSSESVPSLGGDTDVAADLAMPKMLGVLTRFG